MHQHLNLLNKILDEGYLFSTGGAPPQSRSHKSLVTQLSYQKAAMDHIAGVEQLPTFFLKGETNVKYLRSKRQ